MKENRLDIYLANKLGISRSKVQKLNEEGKILVNGVREKDSFLVTDEDDIEVNDELSFEIKVEKENIPLDVVYEDDYLVIVNKPSGMVVHPAPGNYSGTLVNALLYRFDLSKGEASFRPGIVHRIDKDTSGLLVVAKTEKTHELLSEMFKNKEVKREYITLVEGVIREEKGTIDAPIGRDPKDREKMCVIGTNSKEAVTHFKVLQRYSRNTLLKCILDTGRTHQIRVHMAYIGHRVVNDPLYGKKFSDFGQFLHSASIDFNHPITKEHIHFECDLPKEFQDFLDKLD